MSAGRFLFGRIVQAAGFSMGFVWVLLFPHSYLAMFLFLLLGGFLIGVGSWLTKPSRNWSIKRPGQRDVD
jgi:hypothetical protein